PIGVASFHQGQAEPIVVEVTSGAESPVERLSRSVDGIGVAKDKPISVYRRAEIEVPRVPPIPWLDAPGDVVAGGIAQFREGEQETSILGGGHGFFMQKSDRFVGSLPGQ